MSETGAELYEPPKFAETEKQTGGKLGKIYKRVLRFVTRPRRLSHLGPAFSPAGIIEAKSKEDPTLAEQMSEIGCAVWSFMSAGSFAAGTKGITAEGSEWRMRFDQMDKYAKHIPATTAGQIEKIEQDIEDLFHSYQKNNTALGRTLQDLEITRRKNQTVRQIKNLIREGKQVLIYTPEEPDTRSKEQNKRAHIFHAGLKNRRIFSLSDRKEDDGSYYSPKLARQPYTIFIVDRKENATVTNLFPQRGDASQQERKAA